MNIEIINIKEIKDLLFNKSISIYSIAKAINVSRSTLNTYRNGEYKIENMSLELAMKLQEFINNNRTK